ncbi:NAD-dependent epimerase/dehydratase family protein [Fibrisoma montanum]|uniref:NAD-dependent epimerase/dehydratase family protein n=1 Tax=Fibrisoma montanum TaxID=2305895 RepID=A0A418MAH1_9BACT|nr:NmrA family NAD(P)-binding protein [Fibrisoma montanum]RIV23346.1 NAD-dependent epimerase/dehydratase family protein [Fibrisoma montanum]
MNSANQATKTNLIILAGATGDLGQAIAHHLLQRGAHVRALVRRGSTSQVLSSLRTQGATVLEVDYTSDSELTQACTGGSCVVSALSGLRDVIVDTQTRLLHAAVNAGVPRFIPSDYCIDFTRLPKGSNRNLDLRRDFSERLDKASIAATSILNGMFTDLLTGQAPVVQFGLKRVLYWGDADQPMDFTTTDDTAAYTAAAALDADTPRFLRIAGEVSTIRGIQQSASDATGQPFGLLRVGGLGVLNTLIKITKLVAPQPSEVFPPWQGMQYLHNMLSGQPKLQPLDNDRYPDIRWTSIRDVLAKRPA